MSATNPLTDSELLRRFRAGEPRCFDELVNRHHGLVFAVAYARLQSTEAAEDLTQEVFIRSFLLQEKLRDGDRFAPWVSSMARNLATDWLRRGETRSRLLPMIPLEDDKMAEIPNKADRLPAEAAEQEEQRLLADQAIRQLPPHQRELILLHYTEGMSRSDIARHLGVHPSTVGRQLDAAIHAMRLNVEANLKHSAPALRPRTLTPARTVAVVAAAMTLSTEAKASVVKAAGESLAAAAVEPATTVGFLKLLELKLTSLIIGGTAAVGTGKLITAVAAVAIVIAGYQVHKHMPTGHPPSPMELLAATPESQLAGTYHFGFGDGEPLVLETGKVYRMTFPKEIPVAKGVVSFDANGMLNSVVTEQNGNMNMNGMQVKEGADYVELNGAPIATYLGVTRFRRVPTGLEVTTWTEMRPDLVPVFRELVNSFLEGRMSAQQYRENYVRELKKRNIGPSDSAFRKAYYDKILTDLSVPYNLPEDLKGAK